MATAAHEGTGRPIGWGLRVGYAFLGLLIGNAAILVYFFSTWLPALIHPPNGWRVAAFAVLLGTLGLMSLYGTFSFIGWLLVGLPVVLLLPPRIIARLSWIAILAIAALLGPLAFLPIFLFLFPGQFTRIFTLSPSGQDSPAQYWMIACVASVAGFTAYCWLVRRRFTCS